MKIAVGGMFNKAEIADLIKAVGGDGVEVEVKSDLDATMMVKNGQAVIYIGACHTGGGGSLGMPMALLGADKCRIVAMAGKTMSPEDISLAIESGAVAFGLVPQAIPSCVPVIVTEAIKKYGNAK